MLRMSKMGDDELFCAADIGTCANIKNIHSLLQNRAGKYKLQVDTNGGQQSLTFLSKDCVQAILAKSRKVEAASLAEILGMNVIPVHVVCIECSTLSCIKKAFDGEIMLTQYHVRQYKIDLYFPDYKLAVECDERHHTNNIQHDMNRQMEIESWLNCKFIRYSPSDSAFDIMDTINKIYLHIRQHLKA
jgi:very-short-patch-repair endonuclease